MLAFESHDFLPLSLLTSCYHHCSTYWYKTDAEACCFRFFVLKVANTCDTTYMKCLKQLGPPILLRVFLFG